MQRRKFITFLGGVAAAAWPFRVRAQPALPVIGFLSSTSPQVFAPRLRAFAQGLAAEGYVEGQNMVIEYRFAGDDETRLPVLAAELVQHRLTVFVAGGSPSTLAARAATATIPILFETAGDPVSLGFVTSLIKPGGNLTGVSNLNSEVGPKRLELVRELLPAATIVAVLVNPTAPAITNEYMRGLEVAAAALGIGLRVLPVSTDRELEQVFPALVQMRADALIVGPYLFFNSRMEMLGALSLRHAVPTIFSYRPFVAAGGLIGFGANETETYRLLGIYTGKVIAGAKPGDLPVQRSTKVELILNLKTAKALGLNVPNALIGRADEVIE